jgi:CDP-glucose 4,6-dehydratase
MQHSFQPDPKFWRDRRVLLTGHTGFKGAWLAFWLERMGARVTGLALPPATNPSLSEQLQIDRLCDSRLVDIRDPQAVEAAVSSARPEVVFHLAAQALVRESYREPLATFATNVLGTAHVLDALRRSPDTRVAVMVTTDKVYRNREWHWPYREDDALGGHDPYSASKASSESVIESWRLSFLQERGVAVASARAGNVIGGGDWSADRLLPDALRAWQSGDVLDIRRPDAIRPWQHVLDPLAGYIILAERLWKDASLADAYNFGPQTHEAASVREVIEIARQQFPGAQVRYGDGSAGPHEAGWLALETARARQVLGVSPRFPLQGAVARTMAWHASQARGADVHQLCADDIADWLESV